MIQLYSLRSKSLPDSHGIWLAIHRDKGRHVGIVYRTSQADDPKFLHLGFHHELDCETVLGSQHFESTYAWLNCPGFSSDEQLQLAIWFERVWRANGPKVPYGLTYSGAGYFDLATGQFVQATTGVGLTCATFVMAMFADFQLPILDWQSWPYRPTDLSYQEQLVDALKQLVAVGKAEQSHVDAQIASLGTAPRYRPVEVVASGAAYLGEPVMFSTAELIAQHMQVDLREAVF